MMSKSVTLSLLCFVVIGTVQYSSACATTTAPNDDIGGMGGGPFSDADVYNNKNITAIEMTCGRVLVSLRMKYGDKWGPERGGGVSPYCEFPAVKTIKEEFECDEYIVGIKATSDTYINSVQFRTNKRALRKCGSTIGNNRFDLEGIKLLYFSGRQGCYVDRLRLHWKQ